MKLEKNRVYIRITEQAGLLELRTSPMRVAMETPYMELRQALLVLLSHILPARMRVEGQIRDGGFFTEFNVDMNIDKKAPPKPWEDYEWKHETPMPQLAALIDVIIRRRTATVLRYDGIVSSSPSPLTSGVSVKLVPPSGK